MSYVYIYIHEIRMYRTVSNVRVGKEHTTDIVASTRHEKRGSYWFSTAVRD